jgi:hypothetical protein
MGEKTSTLERPCFTTQTSRRTVSWMKASDTRSAKVLSTGLPVGRSPSRARREKWLFLPRRAGVTTDSRRGMANTTPMTPPRLAEAIFRNLRRVLELSSVMCPSQHVRGGSERLFLRGLRAQGPAQEPGIYPPSGAETTGAVRRKGPVAKGKKVENLPDRPFSATGGDRSPKDIRLPGSAPYYHYPMSHAPQRLRQEAMLPRGTPFAPAPVREAPDGGIARSGRFTEE